METSRPLIESRKHTLIIVLASEPLKVEAEIMRMAQVITNLLNNSAKYTEEGWTNLAQYRSGWQRGRDRGARQRHRRAARSVAPLFDLFTQADRTIDRSQGGLGIGLTLVRSLVELHGGSVHASSDGPDQGSEFIVRLPLLTASQARESDTGTCEINGLTAGYPQRILVVNDNVDSARTLVLMLKAMGHKSAACHDGPAAIETAKKFRPTLILLDIGLPRMNGGYLVAKRSRTIPALRGLVIAALTGFGEEQDRRRSEEAGFDRYFVKPVSFPALQELIRSLPSTMM